MSGNGKSVHVNITFRNTHGTDPLKAYASEKIRNTIQKFCHHDTEAHVVLSVEKNRHVAEATFHTDGADFTGKEESDDLYASIDSLSDALAGQMRRHKEKLKKHH